MKEVKVLYKKKWDYNLYIINNIDKVITVMFFASYVDYPRSFYLEKDELKMSIDELSTLAERIRFNYEQYKVREIIPPIVE